MRFFIICLLLFQSLALIPARADYYEDFKSENYDRAFRSAYAKALDDNARAQFVIGVIFMEGLGTAEQDKREGIKLLEKSSENRFFGASIYLSELFNKGEYETRDARKALSMLEKAQEDGAPDLERHLLALSDEVHGPVAEQTCAWYADDSTEDKTLLAKCVENGFKDGQPSKYWLAAFDDGIESALAETPKYLLDPQSIEFAPDKLLSRLSDFYEDADEKFAKSMDRNLIAASKKLEGKAKEQHQLGNILFRAERPSKVWLPLLVAASDNRPAASLFLAERYEEGDILKQSDSNACLYYKKAEKGGIKDLGAKILACQGKYTADSCNRYGKNDKTRWQELAICSEKGHVKGPSSKYYLWGFERGEKSALLKAMPSIMLENPVKLTSLLDKYLAGSNQKQQKRIIEELEKYRQELEGTPETAFKLGKSLIEETAKLKSGKFLIDWSINGGVSDGAEYLMDLYKIGKFIPEDRSSACSYADIAQELGANTGEFVKECKVEMAGPSSPEACEAYDLFSDDPALIAECIEKGHLDGNAANYWLVSHDQGIIQSFEKAFFAIAGKELDNEFAADLAKRLPNFESSANDEQRSSVQSAITALDLSVDVCEEKKDAMGFVTQGSSSLCALLAYSGNKDALTKSIEHWKTGTSDFDKNEKFAERLFSLFRKPDAGGDVGCEFLLQQLEAKPKEHLKQAKACLAQDPFLNQQIVSEAVALQIRALIGDRKSWNKYFNGEDDAVWVLENVDWNSLDADLLADALIFINNDEIGQKLAKSERTKANLNTLTFRLNWMTALNKRSEPLASDFLKPFVLKKNCEAIDFALSHPNLMFEYAAEFADAQKSSTCKKPALRDNPRAGKTDGGKTKTVSPSSGSRPTTGDTKISDKELLVLATELVGDVPDVCEAFGRYLHVKKQFRAVVPKALVPPLLDQEVKTIDACKSVDSNVAYFVAKKEFNRGKFTDVLKPAERACEAGIYDACGLFAHTIVFQNTKTSSSFGERKKKALKLAENGFANGSMMSGVAAYYVANSGTFSGCSVNTGVCPGDDIVSELMDAEYPGGMVIKLRQCIKGKGGDLANLFNSLNIRSCKDLCDRTTKLMKSKQLDFIAEINAKKHLKSMKCK
jgi:TPR repeat protein